MNKTIIKILLTMFMSMTGAKAYAYNLAVENADGVTIYYNFYNYSRELEVTYASSSKDNYSGNVVIPESVEYNGNTYPVTSIGDWAFYDCSGLTSITIPNSLIYIGSYAFDGCKSLTSVKVCVTDFSAFCNNNVIRIIRTAISTPIQLIDNKGKEIMEYIVPNDVTTIGKQAFEGCSGLTSVIIGSGVLSIGARAFSDTNLKKTIWLTNTPPKGCENASGTVNYVSNDQFNIDNKVIYKFLSSNFVVDGIRYVPISPSDRTCDAIDCIYDESAEIINIGKTVSNKDVTLTVKKVNPYTCYGNKHIKDVKLSLGGNIGDYAFQSCTALKTATISNQGDIGSSAFHSCSSLITANISNQGGISKEAFSNCSLLETAELGQNVTSIGSNAFRSCYKLKSIVIPDAVTSLGYKAFDGCVAMISAKTGNGIEKIDEYTFYNCSSLKEINIGSKVKTINQYAFSRCSSLPDITIPQAVTTIGNNVFLECKSLAKVIIADSKTTLTLGQNVHQSPIFSSCPLDYVYIGRDISYQTSKKNGYSPFYRNTSLRAVKITDKETEISENEFYGCTNLQQVEIGDGVTTIGNWAFSGCSSLKYFAFGTQVATIGKEAFSDCTAMEEIISKAQTPPTCGSQALDDINKWECKLYVPKGCMAVYDKANQWKDFFFKEEGENPADDPTSGSCGETANYSYDKATQTLVISGEGEIYDYDNGSNKAPWSAYADEIQKIEIEPGIISVG